MSSGRFSTRFLGSIFDLFLDFAARVECLFYGTFQKLMGFLDPFSDLFWTVLFITPGFSSYLWWPVSSRCLSRCPGWLRWHTSHSQRAVFHKWGHKKRPIFVHSFSRSIFAPFFKNDICCFSKAGLTEISLRCLVSFVRVPPIANLWLEETLIYKQLKMLFMDIPRLKVPHDTPPLRSFDLLVSRVLELPSSSPWR
jgi:hypothetical protein